LVFSAAKENINRLIFKQSPFLYIAKLLTQAYGVHLKLTPNLNQAICSGSLKCMKAMSLYFDLWGTYGSKLGIEPRNLDSQLDTNHEYKSSLEWNLKSVYHHFGYYLGHLAYNYVKIQPQSEKPKGENEDQPYPVLTKEQERNELLKLVTQSNLISGGMEIRHLILLSEPTKSKLLELAGILEDKGLEDAIQGNHDEFDMSGDLDRKLEAILEEG
jgi:hypothetical protein